MRGADGAVRFGQIDSDEHYRLSGSAHVGDYLFCGREVGRLDDDELSRIRKSRIGFVFQNFNLLPRLTAAGNVELPLVYAGVSRRERHDRAMELLGRVRLMDRADIGLPSCREARSSALPSHTVNTRP